MDNIAESILLPKLAKVKSTGTNKWIACCPGHDDRSPSLSIEQTDNGKILLHCFAGCAPSEILAAIGLSMTNLFPDSDYKRPPGYAKTDYLKALSAAKHATQRNFKKFPPRKTDLAFIQQQIKVLRYTENLIKSGAYDGI